ncbi:EAL domain-containing protein [Psychromonas sp.]|nr:EAL domain-containing protein [Psychromonas sp.]
MIPIDDHLINFIKRLSSIISVVIAISLPIGYAFIAYDDLSDSLSFKAKIKAIGQSELITQLPNTWMYAENRTQGILKREPVLLDDQLIELFDASGNLVTSAGNKVLQPSMQRSYPLHDIDKVVGKVTVTASMSPLIINASKIAFLGAFLGFFVLSIMRFIPIRHLMRISEELDEEKERAIITLHSIQDAVLRTDVDAKLLFINSAGEKMLGVTLNELIGKPITEIVQIIDSSGNHVENSLIKALQSQKETSCDGESTLKVSDSITIAVEERAAPTFNNKGELSGGVLSLRDVSTARSYLEQRSWEASHDPLTGLLNRRAFQKHITFAIDEVEDENEQYALMYMDLDRFKVVNDSCGHAAGDELLIQIAQLMQAQIREDDILARLGGDEFGLLLNGCDLAQAKIIANQFLEVVENYQYFNEEQFYTVGISIGITLITNNSIDSIQVLNEADSACYWAKDNGRHQIGVFLESDKDIAKRRNQTTWVSRIISALKEDKFVLYHQVYRALKNKDKTHLHMEVLIRMVDEQGKVVLPKDFLPTAERYDLICDIDQWVINKVFSIFHIIKAKHPDNTIMIAINLSGASINSDNLLPFVKRKMVEFNVDPQWICFEVTETIALKNFYTAIEFIDQCKEMGFKFALDDFGTGASSFEYLKKLPVDYLKIDGSFVQNIEKNAIDREMVSSINKIGQLMEKITIAEFAEDELIINSLDKMGVDYAQGYATSLPSPLQPQQDQSKLNKVD